MNARCQSGQTEVGSQGFVVRQFVNYSISLSTEHGTDKECTDMKRPIPLSHLSCVYSGGSSVRPFAGQTGPTLSLQKTGDHSILTSRSVFPPFSSCYLHRCPSEQPQDSVGLSTARLYTHCLRHSRTHLTTAACKLAGPVWAT
jgi:hypothetical protein